MPSTLSSPPRLDRPPPLYPVSSSCSTQKCRICSLTRLLNAQSISKLFRAPTVLLVMHGGVGTINTVLAHVMIGMPIVVVVESGGAAAAIDAYLHHGLDAVEVSAGPAC